MTPCEYWNRLNLNKDLQTMTGHKPCTKCSTCKKIHRSLEEDLKRHRIQAGMELALKQVQGELSRARWGLLSN